MPRTLRPSSDDPVRLALALCHEVGNLLAAVRLSAYLVAKESDPEAAAGCARDIEVAATQAGVALAPLRPLLAPQDEPLRAVDPAEVLQAVEGTLARAAGAVGRVEPPGADLPDVRADGDALHHLLVGLVISAWEAGHDGDPGLAVRAESDGRAVVFAVEDRAGPWPTADPRAEPRGRNLAAAVAATLAARWGGAVHVLPREAGTRVEVRLRVL